jgi:hypothetical protein
MAEVTLTGLLFFNISWDINFMHYILILFMATQSSQTGGAGISAEFSSKENCEVAGKALAKSAHERRNYVLTYGCFAK